MFWNGSTAMEGLSGDARPDLRFSGVEPVSALTR